MVVMVWWVLSHCDKVKKYMIKNDKKLVEIIATINEKIPIIV